MTTATLQTPLEVILFFTSLATHGVKPQSFQAISDTLKADQHVRESEGYDEARLSPESLQQLYLALLKDEVRNQSLKKKSPSPGGQENGSPNSRKRKISSPVLQSLSDAQEHEHLIPVLVDKLYARYREQALQDIAKEEEAYRSIQQDIAKIGQDAAKQRTNGDEQPKHKRTPSISSLLRDDEPQSGQPSPATSRPASGYMPPESRPEQTRKPIVGPLASTPGQTSQPGTPGIDPYRKPDTPASTSRPPSSGFTPRSYSPQGGFPPRPPSSRADPVRSPLPILSAQQTPQVPGYGARAPPPIAVPGAGSPHLHNPSPGPQADRSSQSPIVLPPLPVVNRTHGSPTLPMHSPHVQHRQSLPTHSPTQTPTQMQQQPLPPPNTVPSTGQYPAYGYPSYPAARSAYPPQNRPYHQAPVITPYGAQSQSQTQIQSPYQRGPSQGQVHPQPVPYQQYNAPPGQYPYPGTPGQPIAPARPSHITPAPSTNQRKVLPKIDTTTPSTKWRSGAPRREKSPVPPPLSPMEPGSPGFGFTPPSEDEAGKAGSKKTAKSGTRGTPMDVDDTPSRPAARGRGGRGRGGRGGSNAHSNRTRSQSVASQTEDTAGPKTKASNKKALPEPGTPMEENPSSVPDSDVGTPLASSASKRRNTLRSIETPPVVRPVQKRKRAYTLEVGSPSSPGPATPRFPLAPTRPGYVLGVRNLPRIAATILNDVTTHKLASMFQKPISEREAPGYRDVVFQPQDLKTIRGQLQAGQRAIIAADAAAQDGGDVGTPSGAAGASKAPTTIWLERSTEVMPPKAIVNSSQLETEICRIFANAVMFNPDPKRGVGPAFRTRAKRAEAQRQGKDFDEEEEDEEVDDFSSSMVSDAREMFRDVERQLAGWRAAERTSVGDGPAGLDGAADDDQEMEDAPEEDKDDGEGEEGRGTRRRKA